MRKIFFSVLILLLVTFLFPSTSYAVCPICTIAVAGGLGVSRWLGIDDAVTGVWIGGLILSSGLWLSDWMKKKEWKIPYRDLAAVGIFYLLTIPPLYWAKFMGIEGNELWGTDKVLLGILFGSGAFYLGTQIDKMLRKINNGKVFVYFQKVIMPVSMLALVSFVLFLITK